MPFSNSFTNLYLTEAKSAQAVLPNVAAGASAPMLLFESDISMSLSNFSQNSHTLNTVCSQDGFNLKNVR